MPKTPRPELVFYPPLSGRGMRGLGGAAQAGVIIRSVRTRRTASVGTEPPEEKAAERAFPAVGSSADTNTVVDSIDFTLVSTTRQSALSKMVRY
jgi:hypothetical protein